MVGNVIFNDFCGIWLVAVNGMDKLQFLKFITLADIYQQTRKIYNVYTISIKSPEYN